MLRALKAVPLALPLMLALTAMGFVLTSCTSGNSAQVRFVHAIQDAAALDIDFNGTKEFTDISFFNSMPSSGYTAVPAGSDTVVGYQTGSTTNIAFSYSNLSLSAGTQYTVVATGFDTGNQGSNVVMLNPVDNNTAPANGYVNFRVIHASPSGPNVDIYLLQNPVTCSLGATGCTAAMSNLAYGSTSSYVTLPYNSNGNGYTLYVCSAGNTNYIFTQSISAGSASEGSIRTLVLTDAQNGTTINSQAMVLPDLN